MAGSFSRRRWQRFTKLQDFFVPLARSLLFIFTFVVICERIKGKKKIMDSSTLMTQGQSAPAGSSTDAKVNSVTCKSAQNLNIESSQIREGSTGEARMMRAGSKRFYFDLGSNKRGHFLKISEVIIHVPVIAVFSHPHKHL